MRKVLIAVIGGRSCAGAGDEAVADAVGREIARRGAVLVCGGLGGVMQAACRGATAEGGLTVGLLPGDDPSDANHFVDVAIPTGIGYARNFLVASAAQGIIAIGGSIGTLSEMSFALVKGLPVAAIGSWELDRERLPDGALFFAAANPAEAADYVFRHLRAHPNNHRGGDTQRCK